MWAVEITHLTPKEKKGLVVVITGRGKGKLPLPWGLLSGLAGTG